MVIFEIVAGIAVLTLLAVLYLKRSRSYWSRKNVPTIEGHPIFGNIQNPFTAKEGLGITVKKCYEEFRRRKEVHGGVYLLMQTSYMPVDTTLIKNILSRDFSHFTDHGFYFNHKMDPLTAHLFHLEGEKWKNMRAKLTPTFTSGKMKMMFKTLLDCGVPMIEYVDGLCKTSENLDIKEIVACYTTDIIGSCAFGLECNSFKDPNAEFRNYGRKILTPTVRRVIFESLLFMAPKYIQQNLPFKRTPPDIESFFIGAVRNVLNYRRTNGVKRSDFIQLFLEMEEKAKAEGAECMTLKEISAQAFVFFLAGFETSSTTMTFCLHELAFNQEIQDKLRKEIRETLKKNDGVLTYDAIMEMKYMDKVLNETLRKYPPIPILNRVCTTDYKVPDTDVTIEAGTSIIISNLGIHHDPEYYPKPKQFDPERFSEENKASRPSFTFLPFGEGPRICIGLRFGLMQAKTGLSLLLDNYKILPVKGAEYDIQFDPKSLVLTKKGKVMLTAEKLTK